MNTKPKLIADIRYYESPGRTEYGNVRHSPLGDFYAVPFRSFAAIGNRYACKLREREFSLPGFDHVFVILTPALPHGVVEPAILNINARVRYVDVGIQLDQWNAWNDDSKHDCLVDLTSAAIGAFAVDADTLNQVAAEVKRHRSQLEIVVQTKETASYRVDVSLQIRPLQEQSIAFLSYVDKQTGKRGRTILAKLLSADHVYPLCGSIAVRDNTITIKPRSSIRATTITKSYKVPISIKVETVLATSGTEQGGEPESPKTRV